MHIDWTTDTEFTWSKHGEWFGEWDDVNRTYNTASWDHVEWSINRAKDVLDRWGKHKAFYGFEPMNDPGAYGSKEVLFHYYKKTREYLYEMNPEAVFVLAEQGFDSPAEYNDLFNDEYDHVDKILLDVHRYPAKMPSFDIQGFCDNFA